MKKNLIWWMFLPLVIVACSVFATVSPTGESTVATNTPKKTAVTQKPAETEIATEESEALMTVMVYFTVSDPLTMHLQAVPRQIPQTDDEMQIVMNTTRELLKGPTEAEQAQGLVSWFNEETAVMDLGFASGLEGEYYIDFTALPSLIPNASTSAGSLMLLSQLNSTLFQFPFVQSVEYSTDGSCEAFWEWLQYECHTVTRADWEAQPAP